MNKTKGAVLLRKAVRQNPKTYMELGEILEDKGCYQVQQYLCGRRRRLGLGLASRCSKYFKIPLLPLLTAEQSRDAKRIALVIGRDRGAA